MWGFPKPKPVVDHPIVVKRQADCSSAIPNNTSVAGHVVVTTAGSGAVFGDLLIDNESGSGLMEISLAFENRVIINSEAFTGGTIEFPDADRQHTWDEDGGIWVETGAGSAVWEVVANVLQIIAAAGVLDVKIKLGDNAGGNKVFILDSDDNIVAEFDSDGSVTLAGNRLFLNGPTNPAVRMSEGGNATNYTEVMDVTSTTGRIRKTVPSGTNSVLDIDTITPSGTATINIWKNTNASGAKLLNIYQGIGPGGVAHQINGAGDILLNGNGEAANLQAKGDTDDYLLYLKGGTNTAHIGMNSGSEKLNIGGNIGITGNIKQKNATRSTSFNTEQTDAEATLSGAATTIHVNVPDKSGLRGVALKVTTLITSGDGATSWTAQLIGGASDIIATGKAFTVDTTAKDILFIKATGEIDIEITPDTGNFSGGVIEATAFYETIAV